MEDSNAPELVMNAFSPNVCRLKIKMFSSASLCDIETYGWEQLT